MTLFVLALQFGRYLGVRLCQRSLLVLLGQGSVVVAAQVGVDDGLVGHHGVWLTFGDDLALRHHDHPV